MSDSSIESPPTGGEVFISQGRVVFTYMIFFVLFYLTLNWVMAIPEPLFPDLSDMIDTDDTGIISMQIAGFFAFLALALFQVLASAAERKGVSAQPVSFANFLFIPAGLPKQWMTRWQEIKPSLEKSDIVLGQHNDGRMALLRFMVAAFPTSGFIGTVLGIRKAIAPLDDLVSNSSNMGNISSGLGDVVSGLEIAFNTTLVGLVFFLASSLVAVLVSTYLRRVHAEMMGG